MALENQSSDEKKIRPISEIPDKPNDDYFRRQLEAISNNSVLAMFILDAKQRCVSMNPAAEKLTGYTFAEVKNQPLHNIIHHKRPDGSEYPLEECPFDRAFAENAQKRGEELFISKDGSFYPVAFTASPILENGKTIGTIIEVRNISEQKKAAATLKERERLALLNSEISMSLVQGASLKEILNDCAAAIVRYLETAFTRIWTVSKTGDFLELQASAGIYTHTDGEHSRVPIGKFKIGKIAAERQPHLTNSVIGDAQVSDQEWAKREEMVAFAGYPLIIEERLLGVIGTFARKPLTETAVEALASVANLITLGIERKQAEEVLKESEALYRALVEVSPQIVWTARLDGYITFCNAQWLDYTGLTLEESLGSGWTNAIHPEHRERVIKEWNEAAKSGNWEIEIPFRRAADESYRWHLARGLLIKDENGAPEKWIGVAVDIDERQAIAFERENLLSAEREAREESDTLRRIGQIISAELDLHKVVQAVTDAATEVTGAQFGAFFYNVLDEEGASYMLYTLSGVPREAFGNFPMPRATMLFGPTFRGDGVVRIDDVRNDPRYGKNEPYHGMPAGHLPVVSYLAVPVISRSGEVLGGLFFGHEKAGVFNARAERIVEGLSRQSAIAMDNARLFDEIRREQNKAEAAAKENERLFNEAVEASRLKDEFLATVSHELRTPLNAITGWSSLLLSQTLDEKATQRAVEIINRNARSQGQIIEDILDVSRIISGKLRLDVRLINPAQVIESAIESARPTAEAKNIRLQTFLDPQAGPISGDPDRLQQILWNLLSNALKFTPKGGRVQVRLERINSHIEISVSDTGQGIPADFLPYVFERFRQSDSSTARKHGGLGLGLAIVRQLVEMHGGSVSAVSPGESQGSTFTVTLPLAVVHRQSFTEKREQRVHPGANEQAIGFDCPPQLDGLRIMIVDDEADARELLTTVLKQCDCEVLAVSSAKEALAAFEEFDPHILVSDIGMPEVDGYELISRLREREKELTRRRIPAIALTAYARVEDRLRALSAGFQMHIPKPVEPAELAAVISSMTEWKAEEKN